MPTVPTIAGGVDVEPLVSLFVADIEEGIEGADVRAGILKCSTDEAGVTEDTGRLLRAIAVLPGLRARGIPDDQIDQMMVGNPRDFFAASRSTPRGASELEAADA